MAPELGRPRGSAADLEPADAPAGTPRGHAYYAAAARQALGVHRGPIGRLSELPAPVFCLAVGAVACGLAALVDARASLVAAAPIDAALLGATSAAMIAHARLGAGDHAAPHVGVLLLPSVAFIALLTVLAGTGSRPAWAVAAAGCAATLGLAPHLEAIRLVGRERPRSRVLRDIAGTAAMLPIALAAASSLPSAGRVALAALAGAVLTADATRAGGGGPRDTLIGAAAAAAAVGVAAVAAGHASTQAGGAAGVLMLWYAVRGITAAVIGRAGGLAVAEYAVVGAGAVAILATRGVSLTH